ncbi:MAG: tail fiber protein [Clostridia bacterium]|nr:tail fiber protein [Clostridia bacterium]
MEPLIGTILLWAVPWVPQGWLPCEGQILPIQDYMTLYSLIGTTYGGNGTTNFQLPDLRGRVPIGYGQAPGGYPFQMGQQGGNIQTTVQVTEGNLPPHTHDLSDAQAQIPAHYGNLNMIVSQEAGERSVAENGDSLGAPKYSSRDVALYTNNVATTAELSPQTVAIAATSTALEGSVGVTGLGQPMTINVMQPFNTIRYIIAWEGYYPQRP